ncbi:hypothetical protein CQ048_18225 [Pseudomonas trivialis]|nr:hypothetical protein CQ048_18225 [Pseudomonas trivialis]PRB22392.1 hypothetical protein CQ041_22435 [Pseudomonas sp. MYb60]
MDDQSLEQERCNAPWRHFQHPGHPRCSGGELRQRFAQGRRLRVELEPALAECLLQGNARHLSATVRNARLVVEPESTGRWDPLAV